MNLQTSILFSYAFNNFVRLCVLAVHMENYGYKAATTIITTTSTIRNANKRLKQTKNNKKKRYDIEIQRVTCHLPHLWLICFVKRLSWEAEKGREREGEES